MTDTATRLLDAAEARMRAGGYHAVSFRDLAADLGIKSASVHYYFPKKEDLGAAVVRRYGEAFFEMLGGLVGPDTAAPDRITALVSAFRQALMTTDKVCLCGIMGAEAQGLPDPVRAEVARFLTSVLEWVTKAYAETGAANPKARAELAVAALEGAMILSVNLQDMDAFDRVAAELVRMD